MTFKENIKAIVKLGRKDPIRMSFALLLVLILPLLVANTLTQVLLQSRASTIYIPTYDYGDGGQTTYIPTAGTQSNSQQTTYIPTAGTQSNSQQTTYIPTAGTVGQDPNSSGQTTYIPTAGTQNNSQQTTYIPTAGTQNNSQQTTYIPTAGTVGQTTNNQTSTSNQNTTTGQNTGGVESAPSSTSNETVQNNSNSNSNNDDDDDEEDDDNDSSSRSNSSSNSNNNNSLAQANTTTPAQTFNAQETTINAVSCKTGFARPLIFGISSTGHQGGYGPLGEKEGGLIKAGSTFATVPINWDHESLQRNGPQDYNPESVNFPIRKAVQTGLVVVVNISGTPRWATGNPELLNLPDDAHNHKAQPDRDNDVVNREFRELVKQAVHDNKDKVKYWSYWNEPNGCMSSRGDCGYNGDSMEDFAYWHKVFYDTVKAEDPSAKIIFGNLDFTGPNVSFIRDIHKLTGDEKVEYDYLGLNVYDKRKNAKFPIEWAKAGYDAQPSNYKKPVWINEWGFDTIWWGCGDKMDCINKARDEIAPLVEDGLNKIRDNDWIYAAQYHHINDEGGAYGLWENNNTTPRPGGRKFLELVNSRCDRQIGSTTTPANDVGACVVASHDLGSDFLKRGQPITLTSVASQPVKTFKYAFYNSDNKKPNGIANHFCVKGAKEVEGDDCPNGSGQLVVEVNGDNNLEGAIQAAAWLKLPNGNVIDSIWRGDIGWNRPLPYNNSFGNVNAIKWNLSGYLGIETFGMFRTTAEMDALDFYTADNKTGYMETWRNNVGSRREFKFNAAGDYPDWSTSKNSEIADLNKNKTALPGNGVITASGSFVAVHTLYQSYWRGNTEWMRTVPISNGVIEFNKASAYTQGRSSSTLPVPNIKVQASNFIVMPDNRIQEQIWLNNQMYQRFIPITNRAVDFSKASQYVKGASLTNTTQNSDLTNSIALNYSQLHVVDVATGKIPQNVQINATFTTAGGTIKDHDKCVMRFAFANTIDGDVDGNCVNDIYDYNVLLQYYNQDNCEYNVAGTNGCRIDMTDINYLKERFGQKCE